METANNQVTEEVKPKTKGLSVKGLWQVLTAPADFFEKLRDEPKVLIPWLVNILCFFAFMATAVDYIVEMQLNSPQLQEQMQGQPMPANMETILYYQTLIGSVLVPLLTPIIAAALALFFGNFVFAGKASFKSLLSVMLYGEIIFSLGALVVIPMVMAKESILVGFNLAFLAVDLGPESLAYVALSKIDLFIIWEIIVIGIGLSIIYKESRNKGYTIAVLSMGMISILQVLMTGIISML